jgi:hypothetical protein
MLIAWARRAGVRSEHGLDCAEVADEAFARAWAALPPARFADFPTLARLLSYMRTCVTTTAVDGMRQQTSYEFDLLEALPDTGGTPEQIVVAEVERAALWEIALEVAATPAERVVLVESFVYDRRPRAIHARHPRLFADVAEVYRTKRNLLDRLARNQELRDLYAERARV